MAARFIRLVQSTGDLIFVRPETIMAFGSGHGYQPGSWITLWGTSDRFHIRETVQEVATLLTPTEGPY